MAAACGSIAEDSRWGQKFFEMSENLAECSMTKKFGVKWHDSCVVPVFIHRDCSAVGFKLLLRHKMKDSSGMESVFS